MENCDYVDLAPIGGDLIHDDVWGLDQLARAAYQAKPSHVFETWRFEPTDTLSESVYNLGCRCGIIFCYPCKNAIEVIDCLFTNDDLHTPNKRRRSSN